MTLHHEIEKFITRLAPEPVCDDCITQTLSLSPLESVDQAARELLGRQGFERRKDACSLCGDTRLATRKR